MAVFDAATGDVIATIPVGMRPIGIQAPSDSGKVYVANETSNTVSVISKSSLSVVATTPFEAGGLSLADREELV